MNNKVPYEAPATGTTGWFLPSAQQWVKMQEGLGELSESSIVWGSWYNNNHSVVDKWEAALEKAGSGNYDSMKSGWLWYWSSSIYSVSQAAVLEVDATGAGANYGFRWDQSLGSKGNADEHRRVRPVLAF